MTMPRFTPLQTGRWTIRPMRHDDAEALWRRRNDPDTARMQGWAMPYSRAAADSLVDAVVRLDGTPPADGWFQLTIADSTTGAPIGDLALHLTFGGRCAEIGYTVTPEAQGRHIASDAAARLARWLFDTVGVSRVGAEMHPDNLASARVAERIGMVFEGRTKKSHWVGDQNSDNLLYGMTRDTWEQWTDRVRHEPTDVRLVEITGRNVDAVTRLATHHSQERLVSPIAAWFAVAHATDRGHVPPIRPWIRAVTADGGVVGALLMSEPDRSHPTPSVWRVMVDRLHQRRGIGERTLDLATEQARDWGARELAISWCDLPGTAGPLYLAYGFEPTGVNQDGEIEGRLML